MTDKRKNDTPSSWRTVLCILVLVLLFAAGVGLIVHQAAHLVKSFEFPTPIDVCMVDGAPVILARSHLVQGGGTQTYVRADGATVKVWYEVNGRSQVMDEWFGDDCDDAQRGQG